MPKQEVITGMQDADYLRVSEEAVNFVKEFHRDCISISLVSYDIDKIANELKKRRYINIMYLYGLPLYLAILKYFTEMEYYELCKGMVDSLNKHNEFLKDKLPTTLQELKMSVV